MYKVYIYSFCTLIIYHIKRNNAINTDAFLYYDNKMTNRNRKTYAKSTNNKPVDNVFESVIYLFLRGASKMESVFEKLMLLRDEKYAQFTSKLIPNTAREKIIGVRSPALRSFAKELISSGAAADFLLSLPHTYHDENVLHAMIVANEKKDIERALFEVERFLPYVDNWAVGDVFVPKVFAKYPDIVYKKVKEWLTSTHTYTVRFALVVMLSIFLEDDFKEEMLALPARIVTEEYYVNMAIAWYYSFALIKQYDSTLPYFTEKRLGTWVHNKSIQKACESYRISDERKSYLRTLKV